MTPEEVIASLMGAAGPPNPAMSQGLDAAFAMPPQQLQKMAGDVVPMPIVPGPNAGPPNQSGGTILDAYRAGMPPNVQMMPTTAYEAYLKNLMKRFGK